MGKSQAHFTRFFIATQQFKAGIDKQVVDLVEFGSTLTETILIQRNKPGKNDKVDCGNYLLMSLA